MSRVFISYRREDRGLVDALAKVIEQGNLELWYDKLTPGGVEWWRTILAEIRACDVFLFVLTNETNLSKPRLAELEYAGSVNRPVLPVQLSDNVTATLLPAALSELQIVSFRPDDPSSVAAFLGHLFSLPQATPLPEPLPEEPEIPQTRLGALYQEILHTSELSSSRQLVLLDKLKQELRDTSEEERSPIRTALTKLRKRHDVLASVAQEIDALLAIEKPKPNPGRGWLQAIGGPSRKLLFLVLFVLTVASPVLVAMAGNGLRFDSRDADFLMATIAWTAGVLLPALLIAVWLRRRRATSRVSRPVLAALALALLLGGALSAFTYVERQRVHASGGPGTATPAAVDEAHRREALEAEPVTRPPR